MPTVPFERLPDDARLWIFGADRPLSEAEELGLLGRVDGYLDGWKAHGEPLTAARDWRMGRFLLVGVDERSVPPSGCSIDALVRVLKEQEQQLGVSLLDGGRVWWRDREGAVRSGTRAEFAALAREGAVDADTPVFDNTLTRVGQLRSGEWERAAAAAWHSKAFALG